MRVLALTGTLIANLPAASLVAAPPADVAMLAPSIGAPPSTSVTVPRTVADGVPGAGVPDFLPPQPANASATTARSSAKERTMRRGEFTGDLLRLRAPARRKRASGRI